MKEVCIRRRDPPKPIAHIPSGVPVTWAHEQASGIAWRRSRIAALISAAGGETGIDPGRLGRRGGFREPPTRPPAVNAADQRLRPRDAAPAAADRPAGGAGAHQLGQPVRWSRWPRRWLSGSETSERDHQGAAGAVDRRRGAVRAELAGRPSAVRPRPPSGSSSRCRARSSTNCGCRSMLSHHQAVDRPWLLTEITEGAGRQRPRRWRSAIERHPSGTRYSSDAAD